MRVYLTCPVCVDITINGIVLKPFLFNTIRTKKKIKSHREVNSQKQKKCSCPPIHIHIRPKKYPAILCVKHSVKNVTMYVHRYGSSSNHLYGDKI